MMEAKFYNRLVKVPTWKWITLHCTQSKEIEYGARSVARWFQNPWDPKKKVWVKASAHVVIDNKEVVQCVPFDRIAYHARGINTNSLGIEFVGGAGQTREQWLDTYGQLMFDLGAALVFTLGRQFGIQIENEIVAGGILLNNGGVTTHAEVTRAYKVPGGHLDPGVNFPMEHLLLLADRLQVKTA